MELPHRLSERSSVPAPRHIPPHGRIYQSGSDPGMRHRHVPCVEPQVRAPALGCACSAGSRSICRPASGAGGSPRDSAPRGPSRHGSHGLPPVRGICRHGGDLPPTRAGGEGGKLSVKDLDQSPRLTDWLQLTAKGFLVLPEPFSFLSGSSLRTGGGTQEVTENGK